MKQSYHSQSKTNVNYRSEINKSTDLNTMLSIQYGVSVNTISKWKNRTIFEDKSSRPNSIFYSLSDIEQALIIHIRTTSWYALDEIVDMVFPINPYTKRSAVYRTLVRNNINTVPEQEREKMHKFKEYEPGYLHMDVTYLPKLNGVKYYLFVAIDRATRGLFYKIYDAKSADNSESFMQECIDYYAFGITHVLTDNGLEFTNRFIKSKKGVYCAKASKLDIICTENNIDHRLTQPSTPKTNGMVERVNGTIKKDTIKKNTYENLEQMNRDLMRFLVHYNLYRRHGGVRKELKVKTPFDALEKWFSIKPELFKQTPLEFKNKILILNNTSIKQQPCET
jgi:transposase InsO family protein